jgi:hypothetical protein
LPSGALKRLEGGSNPFLCLAFSPDGTLLASAGYEKHLQLWDPATGQPIRKWSGWEGNYTALTFSPDGRLLASGSLDDHFVHIWETSTGREVCSLGELPYGASSVSFSRDGKIVAAGGYRTDEIFLWQVPGGKEVARLSGPTVPCPDVQVPSPPGFSHVVFAPDGKTLASGHLHGLSRIWDTQSKGELRHSRGPITDTFTHETFSPDGSLLATWGEMIRLYSTLSWKQLRYFGDQPNLRIACVAFSPDSRMVASGSTGQDIGDNLVHLWEVATGMERCTLAGHQYAISALAFSPDGSLLVSGSRDGSALIWDMHDMPQGVRAKRTTSGPDLNRYWNDLCNQDAELAYRSMSALLRMPDRSVPFMRDRLRPVIALDRLQLGRLSSDLDNSFFEVRERATLELGAQVEQAAKRLREQLTGSISAEARRRLEIILKTWDEGGYSSRQLQTMRALEVLERIGTKDALDVLTTVAAGTPGFRITRAARVAAARLSKSLSNH